MKLEAHNLVKAYKGRRVVNGVSLSMETGEIVGLLGPNGAGKTTSFYMIVGLVRPDEGRVLLDGQDITNKPMYQRARLGLGYLAQEPSIFRKLTVAENIKLVLEMRGLSRKQQHEKVDSLLEELGIAHIRDSRGMVLSGGERRRVEIARALATDPKFMLLDEPFTGVDPIAIGDIQDIVSHLKDRGIGVIITDHNVRETLAITDRAYIMSEGEIKTAGPSSELPDDPIARKFYLGDRFEM
ncbi:MAG: LPS export ABC transporter ATP-binding protein [Armatimonadetes bacterium]|nr:LPS export ABC transporter ATP-binding protein [Armatimonadota bacterium]